MSIGLTVDSKLIAIIRAPKSIILVTMSAPTRDTAGSSWSIRVATGTEAER